MVRDSTTAVIIFIILLVTLISYLGTAYGEHEYFEPYVYWLDRPTICIDDIDDADKWQTIRAVKSWEVAFRDYTNTTKYDYRIMVTDGPLEACDVTLKVSTRQLEFTTTIPIGTTACLVDEGICHITIQKKFRDGEFYYDTVVHEVGHALGLGHRLAYTDMGFISGVLSNDIMFPTIKNFIHITKESLDAIIYFDSIFPYAGNYTIPHNDTWADMK